MNTWYNSKRFVGQAVKTPPSQGGITGSIPVRTVAIFYRIAQPDKRTHSFFYAFFYLQLIISNNFIIITEQKTKVLYLSFFFAIFYLQKTPKKAITIRHITVLPNILVAKRYLSYLSFLGVLFTHILFICFLSTLLSKIFFLTVNVYYLNIHYIYS